MQEVQKHIMFVKALSGKRSSLAGGDQTACNAVKLVAQLWTGMIDNGMILVGSNKKLQDIAMGDIKAHLVKDGLALVQNVVALRKELLLYQAKLEKLAETMTDDTPMGLKELLAESLPEALRSELSCEAFDDVVSCYSAIKLNAIQQEKMKFEKALTDHYENKKIDTSVNHFGDLATGWHKSLKDGFTIEEMNVASKALLNFLPLGAMRDFGQIVSQDSCHMVWMFYIFFVERNS